MSWSAIKISRQAYSKNSLESSFGNDWSLFDYKRRVSSSASVKASYEASRTGSSSMFATSKAGASGEFPYFSRPAPRIRGDDSEFNNRSDILGLAAGGQMYGTRVLRLLIVPFIS